MLSCAKESSGYTAWIDMGLDMDMGVKRTHDIKSDFEGQKKMQTKRESLEG